MTTPFPFAVDSIGSAIDRLPNLFSRIGQLGIYNNRPIPTTTVTLIYRNNRVVLLDPQARGGPRQELNRDLKNSITFSIPHFPFGDTLTPQDMQNVTAFQPGEKQLEQMSDAYNRRLQKVRQPHDQTFEFFRMMGLKGIIVDPLGNVMYDLFAEFGIAKKIIKFDLDNSSINVLDKIEELNDHIGDNLHGETSTGTRVQCSSSFLKKLKRHTSYEKYLLSHSAALEQIAQSRDSASDPNALRRVVIDGTIFESYTGRGLNSAGVIVKFIDDGKGHAFPMGTQEVFNEYDAPPNRTDAVNVAPNAEIAIYPDVLPQGKGIDLDTESNKLCLCERPEVLVEVDEAAP